MKVPAGVGNLFSQDQMVWRAGNEIKSSLSRSALNPAPLTSRRDLCGQMSCSGADGREEDVLRQTHPNVGRLAPLGFGF